MTNYSTQATAIGGRSGWVSSIDGSLLIGLARSESLGGRGEAGTNPEQLFAAAHSASFLEALRVAARKEGILLAADSNVTAKVTLVVEEDSGACQLAVVLAPDLPWLDGIQADRLVRSAAHDCPYTRALLGLASLTIEPL
jgi:lipoyl-dependent peroxiredoxin